MRLRYNSAVSFFYNYLDNYVIYYIVVEAVRLDFVEIVGNYLIMSCFLWH